MINKQNNLTSSHRCKHRYNFLVLSNKILVRRYCCTFLSPIFDNKLEGRLQFPLELFIDGWVSTELLNLRSAMVTIAVSTAQTAKVLCLLITNTFEMFKVSFAIEIESSSWEFLLNQTLWRHRIRFICSAFTSLLTLALYGWLCLNNSILISLSYYQQLFILTYLLTYSNLTYYLFMCVLITYL